FHVVVCRVAFVFLFFFFFFQAEDGIRDFHVTGVQTCALPISDGHGSAPGAFESSLDVQQVSGPYGGEEGHPVDGDGDGGAVGVQIGRASCRERGEIPGGGVSSKEKAVTRMVEHKEGDEDQHNN